MKPKFKQSTFYRVIASGIVLGSIILGTQSHADKGTSILSVSATVKHFCSIDTNPMTFGVYDGIVANKSTNLEATATVFSTCTYGTTAVITLNAGTSAGSGSADAPARRMTAGAGDYIVYQVYSDIARDTVWGNTVPTGVALTGTGDPQSLTVYGSIPSAQIVPEGDYSDQIYVTISY